LRGEMASCHTDSQGHRIRTAVVTIMIITKLR